MGVLRKISQLNCFRGEISEQIMAKETVLIFLVMVLCSTHLLLAEEMSTEEFRLRTNMAREAKRRSPPECICSSWGSKSFR